MINYPSNFSREELIYSTQAIKHGFKNNPANEDIEDNLIYLAYWLQRLRDALSAHYRKDMPINVSSGYRNLRLNLLVKGKKSSAHMRGLAADIKVNGMTTYELTKFIVENFCDYDQVIDEYGRWVHIGLSSVRREALQKTVERGYTFFPRS